jgi:hypothetical protein
MGGRCSLLRTSQRLDSAIHHLDFTVDDSSGVYVLKFRIDWLVTESHCRPIRIDGDLPAITV